MKRQRKEVEQFMARQPAINFSISFQNHINRAGGRTFNVQLKMKILSIALCLILASLTRAQHTFSIDGQKYVLPDYRSELANSKWDFQSSKHPPISLQEAYAKGFAVIKKLRPNESWSLEFTQMMTSKGQAHINLVFVRDEHFSEEEKQDGPRPALISLTVLMNGKVLAPSPIK